jgi:hypothetical protein
MATPAKSAGSPFLPEWVRAARAADLAGSDATSVVRGVATKPGQTELTQTPDFAQASDWERVRAARPALEAP